MFEFQGKRYTVNKDGDYVDFVDEVEDETRQ